jgi:hypothetical protein
MTEDYAETLRQAEEADYERRLFEAVDKTRGDERRSTVAIIRTLAAYYSQSSEMSGLNEEAFAAGALTALADQLERGTMERA